MTNCTSNPEKLDKVLLSNPHIGIHGRFIPSQYFELVVKGNRVNFVTEGAIFFVEPKTEEECIAVIDHALHRLQAARENLTNKEATRA